MESHIVHHFVEMLDNVEGIDADSALGKFFLETEIKPLFMSQQKYSLFSSVLMRMGGNTCSDRRRKSGLGHR